ncbi:NAD-dependent epimerase/dehydratase family protein [Pseudovibrio ascidiaceicola]|uniref:NAD-dependent epimerase/dehydratase family protein n=1 Tax=Pseudovibrio ascidiaceicola TaxID=285279 RepID=UPI001AD8DC5F|nr:NAD-dependent epimerase/dehydratase family protein [Pseudovibrio ascidiaceicola]
MNRILVTGASGYIGSKLTESLLAVENTEVHLILRDKSKLNPKFTAKCKLHLYDGNFEDLKQLFRKHPISQVYHLAAWSGFETPAEQLNELINSNLLFITHLLEAMKGSECRLIVNTGSYWQKNDTADYAPYCLYAATKQAAEVIIDHYIRNHDFSAITLHLHDVYGDDDPRKKIFNLVDDAAATGNMLQMSGGEQHMRLIHVDDVIEAYLCAGQLLTSDKQHTHKHKLYDVGGSSASLKSLVEAYLKNRKAKANIDWGSLPYREKQIMKPYLGDSLPGWRVRKDMTKLIGLSK